jgi:hypothetical protein
MISNFIFSKKKMLKNKFKKEFFFYLLWIGIISSINTSSSLLFLKSYKFYEVVNFLRASAPLVIFAILIIYLFLTVKNSNFFKKKNYINTISIFILFYSAVSICGLFINNNEFFLERLWWNIAYVNVLVFLYLSVNVFDKTFLKKLLLILIFLIFCFYFTVALSAINNSFPTSFRSLYFSPLLGPNTFVLDQGFPRTSGVARALLFVFLFLLSLLCFKKKFFYVNFFVSVVLVFLIFILESRMTSLFFFFSLLIVFYSKLSHLKKFSVLIILITTSINSNTIYYYIWHSAINIFYEKTTILESADREKTRLNVNIKTRNNNTISLIAKKLSPFINNKIANDNNKIANDNNKIANDNNKIANDNNKIANDNNKISNDNNKISIVKKVPSTPSYKYKKILFFKKPFHCDTISTMLNTISTGRFCIWLNNLNTSLQNYSTFFLGNGAQADRYNVKYTNAAQEQSASNIFLYVLTSGGIFSLIFILVIYIIFVINFFNTFFFKKNKSLDMSHIHVSCLLISSFILFRGLTESSFSVFSLDYILFLTTAFFLFSKNNLNNKKYIYDTKK